MSKVGKIARGLDAKLSSKSDPISPRAVVGSDDCGSGWVEQGHDPNPDGLAGFSTGAGDFMQQLQWQQVSASPHGAEDDFALQHGRDGSAAGSALPVS
jgi:hypothetical protein